MRIQYLKAAERIKENLLAAMLGVAALALILFTGYGAI